MSKDSGNKLKKSIFITGATTGIGFELAKLYVKEGHRVGVCGRDLSKLADPYRSRFSCYEVSVTDEAKLRESIEDFASNGGLDIIMANAGISHGSKTKMPDFAATKKIFDINVYGVLNTFAPAIDIFVKQGHGHLVATASVAGFVGLPGAAAYSASKAAVISLCESYSLDLKKEGISVTAICPGFIDTPLTRKNDHSMPFLMPVEKGAKKIKRAIDKKKNLYVFPWQMATVIHILRRLPRRCYRFIMQLPFANYSK